MIYNCMIYEYVQFEYVQQARTSHFYCYFNIMEVLNLCSADCNIKSRPF